MPAFSLSLRSRELPARNCALDWYPVVVAYLLFLFANAMLFVRPAELLPSLGNLQLYLPMILGAIVYAIPSLHNQVRLRTMVQQPVNLCVVGVLIAVFLSLVTTGQIGSHGSEVTAMFKVVLYYLVLVSVITTPERLRVFLMTTALCSTAMIAWSIMDYRAFVAEWIDHPDLYEVIQEEKNIPTGGERRLRHIPDRAGTTVEGETIWFFRLCGLGIFHDPNDLSLLIVATSIISLYFLTDPRLSGVRYLWILPLCVMAVAMHYTYSRGGLLAAGLALLAWLSTRYGGRVAIGIGVMCMMAVPVALGRAGQIDVSGGTGQQRIQLWSEGLMAIRSSWILFGTGAGSYADLAGHVAHNSYVHAFVELGVFGGTMFFGCFFFPALTFFLIKRKGFVIEHPELLRMLPFIAALVADWCMGMCSLSRCYVAPTYMIAGIGASYINLVGFYRREPRPLLRLNLPVVQRWAFCSCGLLLGAYVFVRVFARWG